MKLNKLLVKTLSVFFIVLYVLPINAAIATKSTASNWPYYDGEITSKAAYIMDANSSKVLYEHNANSKQYPASLAKLMTAIIVMERANDNYDDLVSFSYNAVSKDIDKNSVTIGASAGDQLTVKDCLYCLLLPSANDVANALAEHVAGSISDFVLLMNEKAEMLGLTNTHFVNPSGLHDDNQYTSASDMAKILQYAMNYPLFMQISSSISFKHAPIRKYKNPENSNNLVLNTNSIMIPGSGYYYNKAVAGKTGYTKLSGYNLAASAKSEGMTLICVVLGGKSEKIRFEETKKLFEFHFANYKSLSIKDTDPRFLDSISTLGINDVNLIEALNIICNENAHITLPKYADEKDVKSNIYFKINDPYNKYAIGYIDYYLDDEFIGSCTLEGRNIEAMEIYTNYLNLSNTPNINHDDQNDNNSVEVNNPNALISRDVNGNLVVSNTLITLIIIIISLLLLIAISSFLYINIFDNPYIPINKLLFRIKRLFKR